MTLLGGARVMMHYGLDELALAASEKGMKLDSSSAPRR